MPWVKFTADFDWKPKPSVTIAYLTGMTKLVTRSCATAAVAKNKGVRMHKASKYAEPVEVSDGTGPTH